MLVFPEFLTNSAVFFNQPYHISAHFVIGATEFVKFLY